MTELFMFLSIQKGHVLYKNGKVTKGEIHEYLGMKM